MTIALRAALIVVALVAASVLADAQTRTELLDQLVRAYPDFLTGHDGKQISWRDGTKMPVDDGIDDKSFDQRLRNASIIDQLRLAYPGGFCAARVERRSRQIPERSVFHEDVWRLPCWSGAAESRDHHLVGAIMGEGGPGDADQWRRGSAQGGVGGNR